MVDQRLEFTVFVPCYALVIILRRPFSLHGCRIIPSKYHHTQFIANVIPDLPVRDTNDIYMQAFHKLHIFQCKFTASFYFGGNASSGGIDSDASEKNRVIIEEDLTVLG